MCRFFFFLFSFCVFCVVSRFFFFQTHIYADAFGIEKNTGGEDSNCRVTWWPPTLSSMPWPRANDGNRPWTSRMAMASMALPEAL